MSDLSFLCAAPTVVSRLATSQADCLCFPGHRDWFGVRPLAHVENVLGVFAASVRYWTYADH
jgi:hypothetical protein